MARPKFSSWSDVDVFVAFLKVGEHVARDGCPRLDRVFELTLLKKDSMFGFRAGASGT